MTDILIVEDDKAIGTLIQMGLSKHGYQCTYVENGMQASELLEHRHFDLILLDVMLPEISGFEWMEYFREYEVPVIFLTALGTVKDKVHGLRLGADDYIVKPFDIQELVARVETVLRRYQKQEGSIVIDDICVELQSHKVIKSGVEVELTPKEYDLLLLLWNNRKIALYREKIYEHVWREPFAGNTRTVDLHIQRLRKKLGLQDRIQSVHKVGYRLDA